MYSRRVGDEVLSFGHEGILYKRSFVMYDRSTKSLWVHVTGECVKGKRKGQKLKFIPSMIVAWGEWKKRYPKTTVLEGRMARGMMGHFGIKDRFDRYGLSVGEGKQVRLYPYADLDKQPLVIDRFGGQAILVIFDTRSKVARAFKSGGRTFSFEKGILKDEQGRAWDWVTGWRKGKGATEMLEVLPATVWLVDRWKAHNPGGEVWAPK